MYLTKKYKMKDWYGFDEYIYKASDKFYEKFKVYANLIVFNEHTYKKICRIVSNSAKRECVVGDDGEGKIEISEFQNFDKSTMEIARCKYLKDKEFELMFIDEKDDDVDELNEIIKSIEEGGKEEEDIVDVNVYVSREIEKDLLFMLKNLS